MKKYSVTLSLLVRNCPLSETKIKKIVPLVLSEEKFPSADLSIALVGDKRMADLAEHYAKKRYRTDVFAFNLSDDYSDVKSAQIVLNVNLARDRAKKMEINPAHELALYLVHGLLHLCGWDDHNADDAKKMHRKTQKYLRKLNLADAPLPCYTVRT
jgi:probable rRNA maturation factor